MILRELFQKDYEKISPEDFQKMVSKLDIDRNYPNRSGSFAAVYRSNDSKIVYKIGRVEEENTPEKDPYLNFANKIKNSKDPIFPQIYDIKIYHLISPLTGADITQQAHHGREDVNYAYVVTMERLRPFEPTWAELEYIWERYFTFEKPYVDDYGDFLSRFLEDLRSVVHHNRTDQIQDPYAKHFVEVLHELVHQYGNDIYQNNIMMRRTPYGVQPVITDPVY